MSALKRTVLAEEAGRWQTGSMSSEDLTGTYVTLRSPRTMWWATDAMVEKLGPENLRSLKVRAGEHLGRL
jgi:hypothetical protein